jgi:hypothetical protein
MGKHSKTKHPNQQTTPRGMVEMVDMRTGQNHLLTLEAAAADRRAEGRYLALCGVEVLPAAMVDPGRGYCWSCQSTSTIPTQRSGRSR